MRSKYARIFFASALLMAAAAFLPAHADNTDTAFGFNEYLIGKSKSEFKFRGCAYVIEGRKDFEVCAPPKLDVRIAELPAQIQTIVFKNGQLIGIEIDLKTDATGMETVNASVTAKFGSPFAANPSDAANHPTLVRWLMGDNQINSETYSDGISAVIFFNNLLMKEFSDAQREAALAKQKK